MLLCNTSACKISDPLSTLQTCREEVLVDLAVQNDCCGENAHLNKLNSEIGRKCFILFYAMAQREIKIC